MEATMPRLILLGANETDGTNKTNKTDKTDMTDGRFYFNRVFFNRLGYLSLLVLH